MRRSVQPGFNVGRNLRSLNNNEIMNRYAAWLVCQRYARVTREAYSRVRYRENALVIIECEVSQERCVMTLLEFRDVSMGPNGANLPVSGGEYQG